MMRHEPNVHLARLGRQCCEIEVGVGCSAPGPLLTFVAEAFLQDQQVDELRPIVRGTGETVTIHAESEVSALCGMVRILEYEFGKVTVLSAALPFRGSQPKGRPWPIPFATSAM